MRTAAVPGAAFTLTIPPLSSLTELAKQTVMIKIPRCLKDQGTIEDLRVLFHQLKEQSPQDGHGHHVIKIIDFESLPSLVVPYYDNGDILQYIHKHPGINLVLMVSTVSISYDCHIHGYPLHSSVPLQATLDSTTIEILSTAPLLL